jgi:transposase
MHFVFFNRACTHCKIIGWEGDGFALWAKRLERNCYQRLQFNGESLSLEIDQVTLMLVLSGIDLKSAQRRRRYQLPASPSSTTPPASLPADAIQEKSDEEILRRHRERRERRKRERPRTEELPAHLERRERVLDLPDDQKVGLRFLRTEVTERLELDRPQAWVDRMIRYLYVVDNEPSRGVISLPTPVSIVSGSKYGFSVVAAMVSLKFAFHQPTYRQQDWFAQSGWTPRRSTINDMMNWAAAAIGPLYQQMTTELRRENLLLCDETTVPLLGRNFLNAEQLDQLTERQNRKRRGLQDDQVEINQGGAVTSYAWLMMGPLATAPFNVFHWSLTRRQAVTDDLLGDFRGTVVADAYDAYVTLAQRSQGRIDHASCNAHARREFEKAKRYEPRLCAEAESFYIQLYAMEDRAKQLTPAERLALRQSEAIPIWHRMEKWLQRPDIIRAALPRSPFGKAVNYLQNQRMSLQRYLFNGDCPIDNNQAEQTIRPLTVGRRNWLFLGHPAAAPGRMQLLSIVSSAHRHDLIIEDYLQDVLEKLADAQQNHPQDLERDAPYLRALLPDRWAAEHPQSIRQGRAEERQDIADTKQVRRAQRRQQAREQQRAAATAAAQTNQAAI